MKITLETLVDKTALMLIAIFFVLSGVKITSELHISWWLITALVWGPVVIFCFSLGAFCVIKFLLFEVYLYKEKRRR